MVHKGVLECHLQKTNIQALIYELGISKVHTSLVRRNEGTSCISVSATRNFSDGYDLLDSSALHCRRRYQSWDSLEPRTGPFDNWHRLLAS